MVSQINPNEKVEKADDMFAVYAAQTKRPFVPLEKRPRETVQQLKSGLIPPKPKNPLFVHPAELDVQKGNILISTDSKGNKTTYLVRVADYDAAIIHISPRAGMRWSEYVDAARKHLTWKVAPGANLALPAPNPGRQFAVEVPIVKLFEVDRGVNERELAALLIVEAKRGWLDFRVQNCFRGEVAELRRRKYLHTHIGSLKPTEKGYAVIDAASAEEEGAAWTLVAREYRRINRNERR